MPGQVSIEEAIAETPAPSGNPAVPSAAEPTGSRYKVASKAKSTRRKAS
jgi:hypothetical protein